jgi:hypothetical protein
MTWVKDEIYAAIAQIGPLTANSMVLATTHHRITDNYSATIWMGTARQSG